MAVIWDPTDDYVRDDCAVDAEAEKDTREECERCGELVDRLYEVDDRDDAVGYRGTVLVCAVCTEGRMR